MNEWIKLIFFSKLCHLYFKRLIPHTHSLPWRLLIKSNRFSFQLCKKNWKIFCLIRDRYVIAYGVPYRNCIANRDFQTYSVHWAHTIGIVNVAHVHVFNMPFEKMSSMNENKWKRCQNDGKNWKTNKAIRASGRHANAEPFTKKQKRA